jgi:hypothetical protein
LNVINAALSMASRLFSLARFCIFLQSVSDARFVIRTSLTTVSLYVNLLLCSSQPGNSKHNKMDNEPRNKAILFTH